MKNVFVKIAIVPVAVILFFILFMTIAPFTEDRREAQKEYLPNYVQSVQEEYTRSMETLAKQLTGKNLAEMKQRDFDQIYDDIFSSTYDRIVARNESMSDLKLRPAQADVMIADQNGNRILLGVPFSKIAYLSQAFDDNEELIQKDGFYEDRVAFIQTLLGTENRFDFTKTTKQRYNYYIGEMETVPADWRFFEPGSWIHNYKFNSKINPENESSDLNSQAAIHLIVDDSNNQWNVYADAGDQLLQAYQDVSIFFIVISCLFLWFLLPTWVYSDAAKRGVQRPLGWAFIVLISVPFGLTIYLIVRPKKVLKLKCPQCESEIPAGGRYCPKCSYDIATSTCPKCHADVEDDWACCPFCRTDLKSDAPIESRVAHLEAGE